MLEVYKRHGATRQGFADYLPMIRGHLRLPEGDTSEDELLLAYFAAAIGDAERITGMALAWGSYEMVFDQFPSSPLPIARPPLAIDPATGLCRVEEIAFFTESEKRTLPTTAYRVVAGGGVARLVPTAGIFPGTCGACAVSVRYFSGHDFGNREIDATAATLAFQPLPDSILGAILDLTAARHQIRSSEVLGTIASEPKSISARDLLNAYKVNYQLWEGL